jgi:peroxiredoxin
MKSNTFLGAVISALVCSASAFAVEPGAKAPAFTLKNVKGEKISLADQKGKVVVLEWLNFDCPFVHKHYSSGNMQKLQAAYTGKDVVWLSIASSAEGKEGYYLPKELGARAEKEGSKASQVLVDADGKVGKEYDAKTTPHMIVIDKEGKVAYTGAIDSIASTDIADLEKADSYVSAALDSVLAGKPVDKTKTQPYGCPVKYASK